MWYVWLILIVLAIICVCVFNKSKNAAKSLVENGRIIQRNPVFWEEKETFTLKKVDIDVIFSVLKKQNWDGSGVRIERIDGNKKLIAFEKPNSWNAVLVMKESDADRSCYSFSFNSWQIRTTVQDMFPMNITLTNVERTFIQLDSQTKVSTERIKINTHTK